jgi:Ca2+-binding RTX toxin-like protein
MYDTAGISVASAGDVNGDGFDDVLIGAQFVDSDAYDGVGAAYVVFGRAGAYQAQFTLASLDGNDGFWVLGEDQSYGGAGNSVAAAGDVNGDGFADIMVGASRHDNFTGAAYAVFGSKPGEAVQRDGTAIDNTIHGGDFDDVLRGGDGNDTLIGHGGNDTINGGAGDDILFGINGNDTLIGSGGKDSLTGSSSADTLNGGGSKDILDGGSSADTFVYNSALDSTSKKGDTLRNADFAADKFDLAVAITGIDATIASGLLRKGNFDADLAAAVDAAHLAANHAVVFTPDAGNLAGKTILVVDLNGTAGYQSGEDLVVRLENTVNLASLGIEDFV